MKEPGQKAYEAVSAGKFADVHPAIKAQWATIEAALVPTLPADVAGLVERLDARVAAEIGEAPFMTAIPNYMLHREAASTIRALIAELEHRRGYATMTAAWERRALDAEAKLREAVEVMRQISMACDTYGEDLSFGDMKTVHRIQAAARAFLATMEKPSDP